jgi:glutathione S-transferase
MNHSLPALYSFRRCPYAMRARFTLAKSGQRVELREVLLRDKPQSLLSISPKATVPVLVLEDGRVLEESLEIMSWALHKNDPDAWLDETGIELVNENDSVFKKHLDQYKYFDRHPRHSQLYYREQAEVFLQKLENILSTYSYLSGEQIKFVDVAIFPFIRQFARTDLDWFKSSRYINLRRWLETFLSSALFEQTMVKYDHWNSNKDPIFFPQ